MSDEVSGSTEQEQEQQLPEHLRGKSAEEIAQMYVSLERKLGEMGNELGQLRSILAERESARKEEYVPRTDERWREIADELIVDPESAISKLKEAIKREAVEEATRVTSTQLSARQQLEEFFRTNPDLAEFREVVSVIGEMTYWQNPHLPFSKVLELTAQQARQYIADLERRITSKRSRSEEKRAGATTGGGSARETAPAAAARPRPPKEEDEVMAAIRELHEWRKPRISPR